MNKIHSLLLTAAATIGVLTSCSDVPMPYDINSGGTASFGKVLPYKSASLSTFSAYDLKEGYAAWSQGSSYTQATGYQTWNGASSKSNVEVESYLISPALNTKCASGKVRFCFDQTLRYTNNVTGWQNNHKIFISKNFDGNVKNFNEATWTQIAFTPEASPYSDWTLYTSGYLQVPDEFVNHDSVYIAFYFYAPASASTTWELENFLIEEGVADNSGSGGGSGGGDGSSTNVGTKEAPLTVAEAKTKVGSSGYVKGYIVGYVDGQKLEEGAKFEAATESQTELLLADSPTETNPSNVLPVQLPIGDIRTNLNPAIASNIGKQVTFYGSFENYFGTPGMKSTSWAEMNGQTYGTDPDATPVPAGEQKGDGTQANPYNVAAAIAFTSALPQDQNSDAKYIVGIICNDPNVDTGQYGNATFYISDDGTDANKFYIFRIFDIGNQHFTDANKIKKGDKVVIYSPLVNYRGNTPETAANQGYLISINDNTSGDGGGGGDTPPTPGPGSSDGISISGTTVTLTNAGTTAGSESISVDLSTLNYSNAEEVGTVSLGDGTTVTFAAGTNSNAPKYYTATNGVRVYANNTITFVGTKLIATVVMECDSYNGTDYVGNTTATLSADGNTLVYNNASSTAGTQLRVKTITITYAQ